MHDSGVISILLLDYDISARFPFKHTCHTEYFFIAFDVFDQFVLVLKEYGVQTLERKFSEPNHVAAYDL